MPDINELSRSFITAAKEGDINALQVFIAAGIDVNSKDENGNTPLHHAVEHAQEECIHFLISHGADVQAVNNYGESLLFTAALIGHDKIIRILHEHGAELDAKNPFGNTPMDTPLCGASANGHLNAIQTLVELGADVNAFDSTALFKAASYYQAQAIRLLVKLGARINAKNNKDKTALLEAVDNQSIEKEHLEAVRVLCELGAELDPEHSSNLSEALDITFEILDWDREHDLVENDNLYLAQIRILIEAGAGLETILHRVASRAQDPELIKLIVSRGADINAKDKYNRSPLDDAVSVGNVKVAKALVEMGARITEDFTGFYEFLELDISSNQEVLDEMLSLLMPCGFPSGSQKAKLTEIMLKFGYGHNGMLSALIKLGANIHAKDSDGNTILHKVMSRTDIVFFLNMGLKSNIAKEGFRALDPDSPSYSELIKLLEYGIDLHAKNKWGNTALHYADPNSILSLAALGADIETKNFTGKTPLQFSAVNDDVQQQADRTLLGLAANIAFDDSIDENLMALARFADNIHHGSMYSIPKSYDPQHDDFINERFYHQCIKSGIPHYFADRLRYLDIPESLKLRILSTAKVARIIKAISHLIPLDSKDPSLSTELTEAEENEIIKRLKFMIEHGLISRIGLEPLYHFLNKQTPLKALFDKALKQTDKMAEPFKLGIDALHYHVKNSAETCLAILLVSKYPETFPTGVSFSEFQTELLSLASSTALALRQSLSGLATISGSTFKAFEYLISNQKPDLNKIPSDKCDYLAELIEMVRNFPRLILPFSFYPKLNEWLVSLEMLQVEMKAKTVAHTAPYSIAQTFGGSGGAAGGNSSSERVAHEFALNNKG